MLMQLLRRTESIWALELLSEMNLEWLSGGASLACLDAIFGAFGREFGC